MRWDGCCAGESRGPHPLSPDAAAAPGPVGVGAREPRRGGGRRAALALALALAMLCDARAEGRGGEGRPAHGASGHEVGRRRGAGRRRRHHLGGERAERQQQCGPPGGEGRGADFEKCPPLAGPLCCGLPAPKGPVGAVLAPIGRRLGADRGTNGGG
eukprot:scaffold4698_cov332-Prasinococcus_capsulatus_cf.AAC.1